MACCFEDGDTWQILQNAGDFLISWRRVSFTRHNVFHEVRSSVSKLFMAKDHTPYFGLVRGSHIEQ